MQLAAKISIHALREEGDESAMTTEYAENKFQSTPSARRATYRRRSSDHHRSISIHALREEGDHRLTAVLALGTNFNPRPP